MVAVRDSATGARPDQGDAARAWSTTEAHGGAQHHRGGRRPDFVHHRSGRMGRTEVGRRLPVC